MVKSARSPHCFHWGQRGSYLADTLRVCCKIELNWEFLLNTLKEPSGYVAEYIVSKLWKNSWWVAQAHSGHIVINIVKETLEFFHKVPYGQSGGFVQIKFITYPQGKLKSKWWACFKWTHNLPAGLIEIKVAGKLINNPQLAYWVSCE